MPSWGLSKPAALGYLPSAQQLHAFPLVFDSQALQQVTHADSLLNLPRLTSPHLTSPHLTSPHLTSPPSPHLHGAGPCTAIPLLVTPWGVGGARGGGAQSMRGRVLSFQVYATSAGSAAYTFSIHISTY